MKKLPFYLKIVSFVLLILIWDYIFINYRNLPLSVPIHFDWDGKPNFFVPRIIKEDTRKAERIVSVFHLIIMLILTVITYESIAVGLGKYEAVSPVTNYLIVVLFLGVIAMMIYSYIISKRTASQNSIN